jgi:transposase
MSAEQGVLVEGLEEQPAPLPLTGPAIPGKPRFKAIDRQQLSWQEIDIERLIEQDHPVRAIWDLVCRLNLSRFDERVKAVEGVAGREATNPRLLISLWLYAVSRGVRSARELAEWSKYDPGCQWLTGLGRINHHTLSNFVTAEAAALDQLFLEVLEVLMAEDLADLERVMHDGTKIRACAGRSSFKREQRLEECRKLAEEHLAAVKQSETKDGTRKRAARERAARERVERLDRAAQQFEQLQADKPADEQAKVRVSLTDPDARVMKQGDDGGFAPSYNAQISTDARSGVIVAYDVSQAGEDTQELMPAVDRIEQNVGGSPEQMVADGGYTTRQNVMDMAERPTEFVGSFGEDRSRNKLGRHGVSEAFMPDKFVRDEASNSYTCPAGKQLRPKGYKNLVGATERHYRAKPSDCQACPHHSQCCPNTVSNGRLLIKIDEHSAVAEFREKMQTPAYRSIYRQRAQVAEFSNACLKEKKGLRRFLRRGMSKVRAETGWACISCNVSIWIRLCWKVQTKLRTTT